MKKKVGWNKRSVCCKLPDEQLEPEAASLTSCSTSRYKPEEMGFNYVFQAGTFLCRHLISVKLLATKSSEQMASWSYHVSSHRHIKMSECWCFTQGQRGDDFCVWELNIIQKNLNPLRPNDLGSVSAFVSEPPTTSACKEASRLDQTCSVSRKTKKRTSGSERIQAEHEEMLQTRTHQKDYFNG